MSLLPIKMNKLSEKVSKDNIADNIATFYNIVMFYNIVKFYNIVIL